jgi:hypothetical protein
VAPTVSLSSPTADLVIGGTVVLSAAVSDPAPSSGVASVQYKIDGKSIGNEITAAPYSSSFDATSISGGSHDIIAVARDGAGNISTSSPVTVSVAVISNPKSENISMTISPGGYITELLYKSEKVPISQVQVAKLILSGGQTRNVKKFESIGGDKYRLSFSDSQINFVLEVKPKKDYFVLRVSDFQNTANEKIETLEFFRVNTPGGLAQASKSWAVQASDSTIFVNILPLNIGSECGIEGTAYICQTQLGNLSQAGGVLILTPNKDYFTVTEQMILAEGLPYVESNGKWFRSPDANMEPYLFATFTHANHEKLLADAVAGGFKEVLMIEPLVRGSYNIPTPGTFSSLDQMVSDMRKFQDAGIKIGIHGFFNYVQYTDPLFHLQDIFKVQVGELAQNADGNSKTLVLNPGTFNQLAAKYYGLDAIYYANNTTFKIQIDHEIIQTDTDTSGATLKNASRAMWGTAAASHQSGSPVYIIPNYSTFAFFVPSSQSQVQSAASFAQVAAKLGVNFIYADGYNFSGNLESKDKFYGYGVADTGIWSYLQKVKEVSGKYPSVQFGNGGKASFLYYFYNRSASDDGVLFNSKDHTKNYKARYMLADSPYKNVIYEMGWWKFNGSAIGTGRYDYESTTEDDIHYAMIKTLANGRSVGLQMSSYYERLDNLNDLLSLMKSYNEFIRRTKGSLGANLLNHLANLDVEAELVNGSKIIEKKVTRLNAWWNGSPFIADIQNSFDQAMVKVEIRPKFDYYGFEKAGNKVITNYQNSLSGLVVSPTAAGIDCQIQSNGNLLINNRSSTGGGCSIKLTGSFDLTSQRGLGLSLVNDSKTRNVTLAIYTSSSPGYRVFQTAIDKAGANTVLFTEPEGGMIKMMHWDFDYKVVNSIILSVQGVLPGEQSTVTLKELKSLVEKPNSPLVNPVIQIGDRTITFPVTLYTDDTRPNIIEYNGTTGKYDVYSSNFKLLSSGQIEQQPLVLSRGIQRVQVFGERGADNSNRADVRLTFYNPAAMYDNGSYTSPSFSGSSASAPIIVSSASANSGGNSSGNQSTTQTSSNFSTEAVPVVSTVTSTNSKSSVISTSVKTKTNGNPAAAKPDQFYNSTKSTSKLTTSKSVTNLDNSLLAIPTTTIDTAIPRVPSWIEVLKSLFLEIINRIKMGAERTVRDFGII